MHGIGACDCPCNAARQLPHVLYQIVQRYRPTPCPADIHCHTDRDIVVRCVSSGGDPGAVTVRSIMSRDPVTVEAGADIRRAMETMRTAQVRRLPVTEGGKLAGMLSIDDIARSGKWDMECAQALCGITANVCRR